MVKKILCFMVGAAFVLALSGTAFSADATVTKTKDTVKTDVGTETTKTKVKETAEKTVTKEKDVAKTAAGKEVTKVKTVETADKTVEKTKSKVVTPEGTEKVKEKVTQTDTTKEDVAKVVKHFKEGDVAKETVTFRSYTDENGGTLIVLKDKKEMRYPAKNYKDWKHNVLAKKEKEVVIHTQWDPKLNANVVTSVEKVK